MQVIEYVGRIEFIPERDIEELRGFLKGINTEFEREEDRVLISSILPDGSHILRMNQMRNTS